jgi:small-conductance mechanosensitive channel
MTTRIPAALWRILIALCLFFVSAIQTPAQEADHDSVERAPLYIDGQLLFDVRGASAFPARERARAILDRLVAAAEDPKFSPDTIELRETANGINLAGSNHRLMTVTDADARVEGLETRLIAEVIRDRIAGAIQKYREARSPEGIRRAVKAVAVATVVFIVVMAAIILLARLSSRLLSHHFKARVELLERKSQNIVKFQNFWSALQGVVRFTFIGLGLIALCYYITTVLFSLPWTRGVAVKAIAHISEPLRELGQSFLEALPGLVALLIVFIVARSVLKIIRAFFERIRWGRIRLANFEPDWAVPTERLVRIGVIALAVVIGYPFIPGSGSEAFKGLSIFAGVILSLGSSSIVANIIAGYSLIYRRAFQVGDCVTICGVIGEVEHTRILATHLRTPKNERVTFPNSLILNNQVVNYSTLAKERGLILHTDVGIGYEVPWRTVEALLFEAAGRTPDVLRDPAPFVLQKRLGDFSPVYELNVYINEPAKILAIYSALHASIQDAFADAEIQIMTPNYVADTEEAKIPPREIA